ncbi:SH3 domain-containing protein [Paeniglutamicibacter sp. ZC-3]|uniref:SH3 domain-containing protein n=1 Tax=Paeniglutamicibacter sp. ZC-3 TaxID=2986919 RepID=UPI0021F7BDAD|nr:SH3 domain-containing protein [Paeniglutamicibacter sp. ZC-3]MCV9994775.1 SH3 domain-containing protein [Paeniglutamicibacter sp. ZC-3]
MATPKYIRALFAGVLAAGMVFTALPATSQVRVNADSGSKVRVGNFALPLDPDTYRMTSPMGPRCMPVVGGSTHHLGQDMGTRDNAPIYAVAAGTVRKVVNGTGSTSGQVVVTHRIDGGTYESAYMHMWPNDVLVKTGQKVAAGQKIALVGSSGPSTGPHLHLEIWKDRFYSSDSNVRNPRAFLKDRGLDLNSHATATYAESLKTCTYYARGKAELFASASADSKVLARPNRNAPVSSKPGAINGLRNGSFVKVKYGSVTGWMNRFAVTPYELGAAPEGSMTSTGTVTNGVRVPFAKYSNPYGLNMRSGAATWYSKLLMIPAGTTFEAYESSAGWLRVKYKGTEGWVSASLARKTASIDQTKLPATHEVLRDLKLRSGAGTTYQETHPLKRGAKVAVRQVRGGWSQIQSGKHSGWVSSADMKKIGSATPQTAKPPVAKPTPTKATHETTANLNMRAGAGTNTKIVKVLRSGTDVIELRRQGTWSNIKAGNAAGWVSNKYLRVIKPAATKPPVVQSVKKATYTSKAKVVARKSASAKAAAVVSIPAKTNVTVDARSGSWLRVKYAGKTGWVPANQLSAYKAPAKPKPPVVQSVKKATYTSKVKVVARKSASAKAAAVVSIPAKKNVTVDAKSGSWLRVKYAGKTGWVPANQVSAYKAPAKPKPPVVQSVKKTTYTSKVKVVARKSASAKAAAVVSIPAKKNVTVDAKSGSWLRVKYAGKTGWVPANQLSAYKAPAKSRTTTVRLNLRTGTNTSTRSLLVIPKGKKITVKATRGSWTQTSYSGKTGWVSSRYLR